MKARINNDGCVEIERSGKYIKTVCPWRDDEESDIPCGCACPMLEICEPNAAIRPGTTRWLTMYCGGTVVVYVLDETV
jgi:hypothetical protein